MHGAIASLLSAAAISLASAASAQFTDLQPGTNFPTATVAFGNEYSEEIDVGDVDGDGDFDVLVANGGDRGNQPNRIFINNGGLQGGTEGTFTEETSTRFAGFPDDRSRDADFVDIDNDGDLDIFVSNVGGNTVGQVSRFYVNDGAGFFTEETNTRWGQLEGVHPSAQVLGGDVGPWRDWSCDCDFGDLDDDGDLDLFFASYGPSVAGNRDSRIFLNDGTGVFDELRPWVDVGADIRVHAFDVEMVDLDGDLDFDVVLASRDSQSRVYMNNTYGALPGSVEMFTDTTQTSLIDQGAAQNGTSTYDTEFGDLDGDGDFDAWVVNYDSFRERHWFNVGTNVDGVVLFESTSTTIKGDPNQDEADVDFFDFDGDGDIDAMLGNASGINRVFAGGIAQGGGVDGQYHRTGTSAGDSLYPFMEVLTVSGGVTHDGEVADVDGDGDDDILLANDTGASNRLLLNALGIPDSHAPTFAIVDAGQTSGADRIVHAQLRDNSPHYLIAYYDVVLIASLDGAPPVTIDMFAQGAQQFRGVIPGAAAATCVQFTIEATDGAGNTGVVSGSAGACPAFTDLGDALAGVNGEPSLVGTGPLTVGSANALTLSNAAPSALAMLFVSLADNPVPFKGGTLHAVPELVTFTTTTSPAGAIALPFIGPATLPSGFVFVTQWAIQDAAAVQNVALSNAVLGAAP